MIRGTTQIALSRHLKGSNKPVALTQLHGDPYLSSCIYQGYVNYWRIGRRNVQFPGSEVMGT